MKPTKFLTLILLTSFCLNLAMVSGNNLKNTAIPVTDNGKTTNNYHIVALDYKNPQFKEKLINIKTEKLNGLSYYHSPTGLNFPYNQRLHGSTSDIYLRKTVAKKLKQVNDYLKPYKLNVFILDGFRSYKLQNELWQFFLNYAKTNHPNYTKAECENFAANYCSNPKDFSIHNDLTWFTHSTGGSVDLTLQSTKTGELLYMGGIFDDPNEISHTSYYEINAINNLSSLAAQQNRRILYNAMTKAGFTNYAFEWWHYDWGNQMWLMNLTDSGKVKGAFYGAKLKP